MTLLPNKLEIWALKQVIFCICVCVWIFVGVFCVHSIFFFFFSDFLFLGDIITILDDSKEWWKGELNGKTGIFPGNYTQKL